MTLGQKVRLFPKSFAPLHFSLYFPFSAQVAWLLAVTAAGGDACKNLKLKFDVRKIMERELQFIPNLLHQFPVFCTHSPQFSFHCSLHPGAKYCLTKN
jgi:hypothetical protein